MSDVIRVRGLEKRYGDVLALGGLDLSVSPGEVHGFLGPNGAGKTTTLRVLLGLLKADAGTIELLGGDPWADAVELHRRLAYIPGDVELWPKLSGGEAIDILGRLRGSVDKAKRDELCDRFDFDPTKKGKTYSKGNRQKAVLLVVTGVAMGLGSAVAMAESDFVWSVTASHLAFIPGLLVILGIAGLLYFF